MKWPSIEARSHWSETGSTIPEIDSSGAFVIFVLIIPFCLVCSEPLSHCQFEASRQRAMRITATRDLRISERVKNFFTRKLLANLVLRSKRIKGFASNCFATSICNDDRNVRKDHCAKERNPAIRARQSNCEDKTESAEHHGIEITLLSPGLINTQTFWG